MLKRERLATITNLVDQSGVLTVRQISDKLGVSLMTVRRDLDELANARALIRLHGGAQSLTFKQPSELSRAQKRNIHVQQKEAVAKLAAGLVTDRDVVYIGPGTTNELLAQQMGNVAASVITNSLPVFQILKERAGQINLQLIGGAYRERSGAFIGSLANNMLGQLQTTKAFVSVNGIDANGISNANVEEGQTQQIALDHAKERYVVADSSKLGVRDFYAFYQLDRITALITDNQISAEDRTNYSTLTQVLTKP